jgi:His-Xaa-Ser system protein HxsD
MAPEAVVDFDAAVQSLSALNAAAYRLADTAGCLINKVNGRYVCRLNARTGGDATALRERYLALVTDENVREDLRGRTEPVRNLILSLAFGALAEQSEKEPSASG